jgi:molybdopterin synthase catalytic subunit
MARDLAGQSEIDRSRLVEHLEHLREEVVAHLRSSVRQRCRCASLAFRPMNASIRVALRGEPLDPAALLVEVGRPDSGATALFLGTARDHSDGKTGVTHLEYEAYAEHVNQKLNEICSEASERWPVMSMVVEHRVGDVAVGEASVAVAVATAHRADAFDAARYVIDELKKRVPIWKREHWPGGAEWVEGA